MARFFLRRRAIILPSFSYATAIGNGVTLGRADLPVHGSATVIYVNSQHANRSDSNSGTDPNNPKATIDSAVQAAPTGGASGTRIRPAIGMVHNDTGAHNMSLRGGLSALYPTVIEGYDPADPENPNLWGAGTTKATMPQISIAAGVNSSFGITSTVSGAIGYFALRGLYFESADYATTGSRGLAFSNGGNTGSTVPRGFLLERCLFDGVGVGFDFYDGVESVLDVIVRDCGFKNVWYTNGVGAAIYMNDLQAILEDNDFHHCGWKLGAARSDAIGSGGASNQAHATYGQYGSWVRYRRNYVGDASEDALSMRGGGQADYNLICGAPTGIRMGVGASGTETARPSGVVATARQNLIIGGRPRSDGGTYALYARYTQTGTRFEENLIWDAGVGSNGVTYAAYAHLDVSPADYGTSPAVNTTVEFKNNLMGSWGTDGISRYDHNEREVTEGAGSGLSTYAMLSATGTYTGTNYAENGNGSLAGWSAARSALPSLPNAKTLDQFASAMGYASADLFGRALVDTRASSLRNSALVAGFGYFGRSLDSSR